MARPLTSRAKIGQNIHPSTKPHSGALAFTVARTNRNNEMDESGFAFHFQEAPLVQHLRELRTTPVDYGSLGCVAVSPLSPHG
eukprot:1392602-Amorphochlora_amoeboformis.AAC.2